VRSRTEGSEKMEHKIVIDFGPFIDAWDTVVAKLRDLAKHIAKNEGIVFIPYFGVFWYDMDNPHLAFI
jgi:tetrahydromethanopterin S-methyltransferase subunit F